MIASNRPKLADEGDQNAIQTPHAGRFNEKELSYLNRLDEYVPLSSELNPIQIRLKEHRRKNYQNKCHQNLYYEFESQNQSNMKFQEKFLKQVK